MGIMVRCPQTLANAERVQIVRHFTNFKYPNKYHIHITDTGTIIVLVVGGFVSQGF